MLEQGREQPCIMHRLVTGRVKYLDLPWNKVLIQTCGPDFKVEKAFGSSVYFWLGQSLFIWMLSCGVCYVRRVFFGWSHVGWSRKQKLIEEKYTFKSETRKKKLKDVCCIWPGWLPTTGGSDIKI